MPTKSCAYARCTQQVREATRYRLDTPDLGTKDFCSITCCYSWFKDQMEKSTQEQEPLQGMNAILGKFTYTKVPDKNHRHTPSEGTQLSQTFPPGTFDFLRMPKIPDQEVKQHITAILSEAVQGFYRFAYDARTPYLRIGPSAAQQQIMVNATDRLHLSGVQTRTLEGLDDTIDFAIVFQGMNGPVHLHDIRLLPGKHVVAKEALDTIEQSQTKGLSKS